MRYILPFQTQNNNGIWNDCGEADLVDVARAAGIETDIPAVQKLIGKANSKDTVADLHKGALGLGLGCEAYYSITIEFARDHLNEKRVSILLIAYDLLPSYASGADYAGGHYVLLTGYEGDKLYWHDPLWKADVEINIDDAARAFQGQALIFNPLELEEMMTPRQQQVVDAIGLDIERIAIPGDPNTPDQFLLTPRSELDSLIFRANSYDVEHPQFVEQEHTINLLNQGNAILVSEKNKLSADLAAAKKTIADLQKQTGDQHEYRQIFGDVYFKIK